MRIKQLGLSLECQILVTRNSFTQAIEFYLSIYLIPFSWPLIPILAHQGQITYNRDPAR